MSQLTYPKFVTTLIEAYANGLRIAGAYSSIYARALGMAFEEEGRDSGRTGVTAASAPPKAFFDVFASLEPIYNRWLENVDAGLESELKSGHFTLALSKYTSALMELRSICREAGYPVDYLDKQFDSYVRNLMVLSLVPKEFHLAPFDVVYQKGKARLLRYRNEDSDVRNSPAAAHGYAIVHENEKKDGNKTTTATPTDKPTLLIVYAPINTFHILDLNPRRSVVKNLLAGGLDVYVLDWGYPDWNDNDLSLGDYLGYVGDAVRVVRDNASSGKVSVLGYCWGGIIAAIYAALNKDAVANLVLIAAPIDFSKDDTILAAWSRSVDVDTMVKEFGHMDGQVLDLGFLMRNPPRYGFDKYLKFFQRLLSYDVEFVDTFVDVERWLYDTPPIPGRLYRQIIVDCYRSNLLASNRMEVEYSDGSKQRVDLGKISVPVLTVVAEKDDLASPEASLAVNDCVSSKDKSVLRNPGGHVALCIGSTAHKKLWPEIARWVRSRQQQ